MSAFENYHFLATSEELITWQVGKNYHFLATSEELITWRVGKNFNEFWLPLSALGSKEPPVKIELYSSKTRKSKFFGKTGEKWYWKSLSSNVKGLPKQNSYIMTYKESAPDINDTKTNELYLMLEL